MTILAPDEVTLLVDGNKVCTKCKVPKPRTEFGPQKGGRDGLHARCRACCAGVKRQYRKDQPEKHRKWNSDHYLRTKPRRRAYVLGRLYGLTMEQYEAMVADQEGKCALCYRAPEGEGNCAILHVDHDHETKRVRRLLCYHCNNGLGRFLDDPELLRRAASYVEAFRV